MGVNFKLLETYLLLERKPVGVRFYLNRAKKPDGAIRPKNPIYFCSSVSLASRGRKIFLQKEDMRCGASVRNLCFEQFSENDFKDTVSEYMTYGTYANELAASSVLRESFETRERFLSSKNHSEIYAVELFPADEEDFDLCVFIGNPKTIMRIIQGYAFYFGSMRDLSLSAMHGMCFETVFRVFVDEKPQLSLLCSGARHFGKFEDSEMSIAIPKKILETIADGIIKTAESCEDDLAKDKIKERAVANKLSINLSKRKAYFYLE